MLSLNWFKKNKEIDALKVEEQKLRNRLLEKEISRPIPSYDVPKEVEKLYKKVRLVNNVLTVVLGDGNIISKSEATIQDFEDVRNAISEDDLFFIMATNRVKEDRVEFEKEIAKNEHIREGFPILISTGEFVEKGGCLYLKEMYDKGIRRSIPQLLAEKFSEVAKCSDENELIYDPEYMKLKKFWLKYCLNPNAQSAEDLYRFLERHKFKIDKHGNFYAYRRVVSLGSVNKELVDFIGNAYNKIKAVWKKAPSDYYIVKKDGEYSISKDSKSGFMIGGLEKLYLDLPNMAENRYTAWHGKNEDYRVGKVNSMPRDKGDDDNSISCSKGYHIASQAYDYRGFGDVPILTIVNPMDVLAVPLNEVGKMRTCRWFFAMTLPEDEKYILDDDDFDVSELGDVFEEQCSEDLVDYVHNSIAEEVKRHTFSIPKLSGVDITNIVRTLSQMKESLTKRVNVIK